MSYLYRHVRRSEREKITFTKSVTDPNSRLNRVRAFLRQNGPQSKLNIVRFLKGEDHLSTIKVRGWSSSFFSSARHKGLLTYENGLWSDGDVISV